MTYRVSSITVGVALVNEFDAPSQANPVQFTGDADGTAVEKAKAWLDGLAEQIAAMEPAG